VNSRLTPGCVADSADSVIAFLAAAPEALGTDPARTFLFGFSQGATIGWTVMTSRWPEPTLLRGACLLRRGGALVRS
jgi:phospholipase/carboxylesterase